MSAECVIGVDLGGTKVLAGVLDGELNVHNRVYRSVHGLPQGELIEVIVAAVEEVRAAADAEISAVGFGIPCLIDQRTGVATMAVNLPIRDMPFRDVMAERLGLPVHVDNDANMAALAEFRAGAAVGVTDAVVLTIGTGIGGGLILNGRLYRGAIGSGAELGHMVIEVDGPRCQGNCPNHGCLEVLASGTALAREGTRIAGERSDSLLGRALADGRTVNGALVTELAHDGDQAAIDTLALIGRNLGVGIANYLNIFNPDVVVIGGGVIAAGELLMAPAREEAARRALPTMRDHGRIVVASFGPEAGMVGAGALALDELGKTRPEGSVS
ncbi:ROK family protein [Conexibacter stalactiti]|uniref:ROK family protein n=1 Tax=Conexibacter stalactiti TaxID=1940611 RepID=A0ABU4HQK4_9ACTN|nr:ROK family protein [Conexibacter stalactiti]MDW5594982.1 ROK family protein [Conexibacter stalactiti]MEC5035624.1 ROK family protein [Conexibacter stalactiti]